MQCKQCGFKLNQQDKFCPGCGSQLSAEDRLAEPSKNPASWLKLLFGFLLVVIAVLVLILFVSDGLTQTVSGQLDSLKNQQPQEAYHTYTSKSFQQAASLGQFLDFVDHYPALVHHTSVRFIDRNAEGDRGSLQALILTAHNMEIPVHYSLIKENGEWKIDSIKLDDAGPEASSKAAQTDKAHVFNSAPLIAAIEGMMEAIQKNQLKTAYEVYSAKDFKKNTSFKEFEQFLQDNDSFSEHVSLELGDLSFDNNVATFSGILTTTTGKIYPVEYDLVEEDGNWKIFHIQVSAPHQKSSKEKTSLFSKFLVGSSLDEEGIVVSPTMLFKPHSGDIYLNLYVNHALPGTQVEVVLKHTDSQSAIPPVSSRLTAGGSARLTFIFSPPPSGWPIGQYKFLATSSTGESGSFEFAVEE